MLKMKSNNKILALALSLMLLVNTFAGLTFSSSAAVSPWIWEPYTTGYAAATNVTTTDNAASGYTTFAVTGDDPYVYPGAGGAGSLAATPALGKINATSLKYGLVRYRTTTAAPGSILANSGVPTVSLGSYNGTGKWTDLELDLNTNELWDGEIDWFRYDMFDGNTGTVDVAFIAFFETDTERDTYAANRAMPVDYTTTDISVYGPDLQAINSTGTYNIDTVPGCEPFSTSWTDAGFAAGSSLVRLSYNNFVYVGDYNFKNVTKIEITYHTDGTLAAEDSANPGTMYTLGLSKVPQSFGWTGGEAAHFNNAIAYDAISNGTTNGWPAARTVTITECIDTSYNGGVWLTTYGCNGQPVVVTGIKLYSVVPDKYDVSVGTVTNGTVTVSPAGEVEEGTTVTVTASPDSGYKLDEILVNGSAITGTTFEVTEDAVVTATFTLIPPSVTTYEVSVGTVENGTVAVSTEGTVEEGTTITVTATPDTGYELNQILVNGTAITGNTFEVAADSVVTATFTKTIYEVSVGTVENGRVWVNDSSAVGCVMGSLIVVTATPDEGYELTAILVDGAPITGTSFNVTGNHVVTATFTSTTPDPTPTYDGSINIDSINSNIWAGNTTIVFGDSYGGEVNGTWHNAILCEYNSSLDAYVVVEKWNQGESRSMQLGAGKIIIDSAGTGVTDNQSGWDAVQVGSVIYLEGVDFTTNTLSPNGAVAYISNNTNVPTATYTVTVGYVENGTVTVSPEGEADAGTTVTVTATPDEGYVLENIIVNSEPIDGNTFVLEADSEVIATFVEDSTGDENTGDENTGDENTGDENTGDENTGDENTGDENTGDENTGDENTGDENTGDENTGDENTGDENTGDENTGDENTGNDNTDDENDNAETDDAAVTALISLMIAAAFLAILLKKRSAY